MLRSIFKIQGISRSLHVANLTNRGVIRVSGSDCYPFLQGLLTNDVQVLVKLKCNPSALYSLMLNVQGRVVNDFILFNVPDGKDDAILMDTDKSLIPQTISTFKKFKLRRKLDITDVTGQYCTVAAWNAPTFVNAMMEKAITYAPDPRLQSLGFRVIVSRNKLESLVADMSNISEQKIEIGSENQYHLLRYSCGVPEGAEELPPGHCLPLESNCDFLNGVSFSKGCYVGQELTARTHNIGVTRKRLLPIKLSEPHSEIQSGSKLYFEFNGDLKPAGEVRKVIGGDALALVRIQYLDSSSNTGRFLIISENMNIRVPCVAFWPKNFPSLTPLLNKLI